MAGSDGPSPLRRGGVFAPRSQRGRLLEAVFALVAQEGYQGVTVRKVAGRAGVSPRTFYELFTDREDCFLAAFDHGVGELSAAVRPAYEAQGEWVAGVRAGLAALLVALDREPALRRLVFVEALGAGPRVLARRAEVLDGLGGVVDRGRVGMVDPGALDDPRRAAMVVEGVVGSVFGVLYARLSQWRSGSLLDLLGSLMATVVLPYRGGAAAARELARPAPDPASVRPVGVGGLFGWPLGAALPADFRLTVRTQMVLVAVASHAGVNNRELAGLVGLSDQGQVSKMASRLREQGLIENTRGQGRGAPKAWHLTPHGEAVIDAHRGAWDSSGTQPGSVRGGRLVAKRGRARARGGASVAPGRAPSASFRMTVRTRLVLMAVAEFGGGDRSPSNIEVARAAGIRDQGQISKLLRRLEGQGLLKNTGGVNAGASKAWELTPRGEALLDTGPPVGEGSV